MSSLKLAWLFLSQACEIRQRSGHFVRCQHSGAIAVHSPDRALRLASKRVFLTQIARKSLKILNLFSQKFPAQFFDLNLYPRIVPEFAHKCRKPRHLPSCSCRKARKCCAETRTRTGCRYDASPPVHHCKRSHLRSDQARTVQRQPDGRQKCRYLIEKL